MAFEALALGSRTHNNLIHINVGRLLDCERDSAGDCIRPHRELILRLAELGFHFRIGHGICKVSPDETR